MSDAPQPQRRDKRYRTRLPIRTRIGGRVLSLFTEDVSFRGLFLCTETPPPVRQLIRIETILPPGSTPFATHGMVVYVVNKDEPGGRTPGVGVQFYGMGDERRAWESFIQFIQWRSEQVPDRRNGQSGLAGGVSGRPPTEPQTGAPGGPGVGSVSAARTGGTQILWAPSHSRSPLPPPPPQATRPMPTPPRQPSRGTLPARVAIGSGTHENRRFHRFPIVLEVWPQNVDSMLRMYSRDVSVGGMFLPTARDIPLASELRLEIRHPHANSVFPMTAVVRRRSAQPAGIGIEFVGLDDRRRRQFFEFIHAPQPDEPDVEIEILDAD